MPSFVGRESTKEEFKRLGPTGSVEIGLYLEPIPL